MRISEIVDKVREYPVQHVLLTGGEPLLQRQTPQLASELVRLGYQVSIETHGEVSIETVSPYARIIMDAKTPSSGMCRGGFLKNLKFLKPSDEVKFVIASEEDYVWARNHVLETKIPTREILFSPAFRCEDSPGAFPGITPAWLAEKILEDRLPVRLQVQLHKILWGNKKGV